MTLGQLQTRPLKVDTRGNVKEGKLKAKKLRKAKCQNTPVILQQDNNILLNNGWINEFSGAYNLRFTGGCKLIQEV